MTVWWIALGVAAIGVLAVKLDVGALLERRDRKKLARFQAECLHCEVGAGGRWQDCGHWADHVPARNTPRAMRPVWQGVRVFAGWGNRVSVAVGPRDAARIRARAVNPRTCGEPCWSATREGPR